MRYTKELQKKVCTDIDKGISPEECAEKYGLSSDVVIKWTKLNLTTQRAAEISIRKYQTEVSETECEIINEVSSMLDAKIKDSDYLRLCENVTKSLYRLVSNVVIKERDINIRQESSRETMVLLKIADTWNSNPFIKTWQKEHGKDEK